MKFSVKTAIPAVVAAASVLCGGAAFAGSGDPTAAHDSSLPEVVVEAGTVTRTVVDRSTTTWAPIESITVDYHVSYSDLDLIKHADVQKLHERVEAAARAACQQIDKAEPIGQSHRQTRACIEDAVRRGDTQIQEATKNVQEEAASIR